RPGSGRRRRRPIARWCRRSWRRPITRQGQREDAALARRALHLDVAAEQPRQIARDRQAEPGAAVLAVRAAVGLTEGLEDDLALVLGDADARVADAEGA